MHPSNRKLFERLERQKSAILAETGSLTEAQLRFRSRPDCWSALDVVDHLIKVEEQTFTAIRSNLPDGVSVSLRDRVLSLVVRVVMRSPLRVKVPASAPEVLPETSAQPFEFPARWSRVREEMAGLLGSLEPAQLHSGLARHPVGGWMDVPQALAFLSAHLRHHSYQLDRLKSSLDCRSSNG